MKLRLIVPAFALVLAGTALAAAAENLVLNGSGLRTKPILGVMYAITLAVPESLKGADAKAIIEADRPMDMVLTIQSRLITRARFIEATSAGFAKAAQAGYTSKKTQSFLDQFDGIEFKKGDVISMHYADGGLHTVYQTATGERKLGSILGPGFKKALFAIWLGDAPVQESLKKSLLGNP